MLNYAHHRIAENLAATNRVTLLSRGTDGIDISEVACCARGIRLYLLLPVYSEHLHNFQQDRRMTAFCNAWLIHGSIHDTDTNEEAIAMSCFPQAEKQLGKIMCVQVRMMQILRATSWDIVETIELDDSDPIPI